MLVSGAAGAGKTWGALDYPSLFFIDVEGGATEPEYTQKLSDAGALYLGIDDGSQQAIPVLEAFHALKTQKHDRVTVVMDSVTKWFQVQTVEAEQQGGSQYGADKKEAIKWLRRLVRHIDSLDMNVILIAHSKPHWVDGESAGTTFDCWDKLEYELDLWIEVTREGTQRIATVRKSRVAAFPMGKRFPWSYDTFAETYGRDAVEAKAKAVSQSDLLSTLIEEHDIDADLVGRWLEKAGVDSISKMKATEQKACISWINENLVTV